MKLDRDKLIKLMGMTTSQHDGEALSALRLANRMILAAGMSWEQVLGASPRPSSSFGQADNSFRTPPSRRGSYGRAYRPPPKTEPERVVSDEHAGWFDALAQRRHDMTTAVFISSVQEFWEQNGYLTKPQHEAVERIYKSLSSGGGRGFRF